MSKGMDQGYRAVASGCWPLIRYDPVVGADGGNPFLLDSGRPRIALADYTNRELRYRALLNTDPAEASGCAGWPSTKSASARPARSRWLPAARPGSRMTHGRDRSAGLREANPAAPPYASPVAPQQANPAAPGIAAGTGSHNGRLVGIQEDD
jgi:hypothetical protein